MEVVMSKQPIVSLVIIAAFTLTLARPARAEPDSGSRNVGLAVAGIGVFAATWTPSAAAAYTLDDGKLAIPIAGPIVFAALHLNQKDGFERALTGLLVMDSLAQTVGIVLSLAGAARRHAVRR
jgi:hypothetical protein